MRLDALTDEDIDRVHRDSALYYQIMESLYDDEEAAHDEGADEAGKVKRLFSCDLAKDWHGVHYLLTGSAGCSNVVLDFLLCNGRAIDDTDDGYGPARTFSFNEMREISEAVSSFTDDVFASRFNAADMAAKEIYPNVWARNDPDDRNWLLDAAKNLRSFVADCAEKGCGCLVYMT